MLVASSGITMDQIGNFAFLQTVLKGVGALICLRTELMFCGCLLQYKQLKSPEAGRTHGPCNLELIQDISKRRRALTPSFQVEVHLYRQKAKEWDVVGERCPRMSPRMFMRQCREKSTQVARSLGYITFV